MPLPVALIAGLAAAGVGGISEMFNRRAQKKQNQKDRQHTIDMYNKQRFDALHDFEMQNAYNDPSAQMQRLKMAGLNPNLVYGSGANTPSATIRGTALTESKQTAPRMNLDWLNQIPAAIQAQMNMKAAAAQVENTQANTDNLKQNLELQKQEMLVKQANVAKTLQDTATSKFQLDQSRELKDQIIMRSKLDNQIKSQILDINADRNEREALANSANVGLTMQKILESKLTQKIQQLSIDNNPIDVEKKREEIRQIQNAIELSKNTLEMQKLELKLKKAGIEKGDDIFFRVLVQYLNLKLE